MNYTNTSVYIPNINWPVFSRLNMSSFMPKPFKTSPCKTEVYSKDPNYCEYMVNQVLTSDGRAGELPGREFVGWGMIFWVRWELGGDGFCIKCLCIYMYMIYIYIYICEFYMDVPHVTFQWTLMWSTVATFPVKHCGGWVRGFGCRTFDGAS